MEAVQSMYQSLTSFLASGVETARGIPKMNVLDAASIWLMYWDGEPRYYKADAEKEWRFQLNLKTGQEAKNYSRKICQEIFLRRSDGMKNWEELWQTRKARDIETSADRKRRSQSCSTMKIPILMMQSRQRGRSNWLSWRVPARVAKLWSRMRFNCHRIRENDGPVSLTYAALSIWAGGIEESVIGGAAKKGLGFHWLPEWTDRRVIVLRLENS